MRTEKLDTNLKGYFQNYFIAPFLSGLYGFAIFFTTLLGAKALGSLLGTIPEFKIVTVDAEMSLLGFVFLFLIRFLKNYIPKDQKVEGYK